MLSSLLSRVLSPIVVRRRGSKVEKHLDGLLVDLEKSQREALQKIIQDNRETDFGRKHNFQDIHSLEDFRELVPTMEYEAIRPFIDKQDASGEHALIAREPAFYAVTSGTTGKPKYIPVHEEVLADHKATTNLFIHNFQKSRPKMLSGKILGIVSPAVEGHMEASGKPFGSTSGHMYSGLPGFVKKKYVVPAEVFEIENYDLKYEVILLLALAQKNITYMSTANPSTIAKLAGMLNAKLEACIEALETGEFKPLESEPQFIQDAFADRFRKDKKRASELRALRADRGEEVRIQDVWPNLQAVGTWTGGSCSIFLDQLKGQFSDHTLLRDVGYLSSEFRGSVPLLEGTNAGVPTIWSGVYEFVEQDEWDAGIKNFKLVHELVDKKKYYIFVTTSYGLYRYDMNDIVQVDGLYKDRLPMLRFVQKGKGVTSITGEKLYENQVIEAVHKTEKEFGVDSQFFILSCVPEESRYTLYYQLSPAITEARLAETGLDNLDECRRFCERVDAIMSEINMEYEAKRKSGRVKLLRMAILKRGSYEHYKTFCLEQGQREGQFKIVALQYGKDLKFDFSPCIRWDSALSNDENEAILAQTRHAAVVKLNQGAG